MLREQAKLSSGNLGAIIGGLSIAANGGALVHIALEGANAMQAEVNLPAGTVPESKGTSGDFCYSYSCGGGLHWYPQGYELYYGAKVQQSPGAFLWSGLYNKSSWWNPVYWDAPPCQFSGLSEPPLGSLQSGVASKGACLAWVEGSWKVVPVVTEYPYVSLGEFARLLTQPKPLEPGFEPDVTIPPIEPPSLEEATKRIEEGVNEDEDVQKKSKYEREPTRFPDPRIPRTRTKVNHSCDRLPGPIFENPTGNAAPFARKYESPFFVKNRPPGAEGEESIYLHWGTAQWEPALEGWTGGRRNIDEWNGFGYRHIVAKHGWGTEDLLETEAALATATPTKSGTEWIYELAVGAGCTRKVVVKYTAKEGDPEAPGIMTSFNYP